MALVGVTELATALGRSKGTISKHAAADKIPVAGRDANGAPLFDVDQVRAAYENGINPLMRRQGEAIEGEMPAPLLEAEVAEGADRGAELETEAPERRSGSPAPRAPGGLLQQQILDRQLRNRRLVRQIGEDEGRLVLRAVVEDEQTTMARRTRDLVAGFMADKASAAYAFAGTPRTEAEWRVWLSERVTEAFNHLASTLALEDDDEFEDDANPGDAGAPDAV
jgi:hypothetical protein